MRRPCCATGRPGSSGESEFCDVGEAERIEFEAESAVYTASWAGDGRSGARAGLKAQLDFHSPFFNTPLEEIGEKAIQATFGGWIRPNERAHFEFAIVEDLEVSTAPDVVLHIAAHWSVVGVDGFDRSHSDRAVP